MNNFMFYANKENRDEMYIFLEKYKLPNWLESQKTWMVLQTLFA